MDVEYPVGKGVKKGGRHQPHVSGQSHGVGSRGAYRPDHGVVKALPVRKGSVIDAYGGQAVPLRALQHFCARAVGEYQTDVGIQQASFHSLEHGFGIGAAAGGENGEFEAHDALLMRTARRIRL